MLFRSANLNYPGERCLFLIRNTKTKPSIPNTRAAAPGQDSAGADTEVVVPPVPPTLMSTLAVLLVLAPSLTLNSMLATPENPALGVKTTSIVEYPRESATFDALGANSAVPPTVLTITQFRLSSSASQPCSVMVTGVPGEVLTAVCDQTLLVGILVRAGV